MFRFVSVILISLVFLNFAHADVEPVNTNKVRMSKKARSVALGGLDIVHYYNQHSQGRLDADGVRGKSEFQSRHNGYRYYFSSQANLAKFERSPQKYLPQYGGYCSYAAANGYIAKIHPDAWRIVRGKLYLQYSKSVRRRWDRDRENFIKSANQNWPGILAK